MSRHWADFGKPLTTRSLSAVNEHSPTPSTGTCWRVEKHFGADRRVVDAVASRLPPSKVKSRWPYRVRWLYPVTIAAAIARAAQIANDHASGATAGSVSGGSWTRFKFSVTSTRPNIPFRLSRPPWPFCQTRSSARRPNPRSQMIRQFPQVAYTLRTVG